MSVAWLSDFFSGDNQIDLPGVMAGKFGPTYKEMLAPLVEATSEGRWPIILPFNDGHQLRFYAAAQDERMLREIRRVLSASIGSAYTDRELPIIKEATNTSEKVLLNLAPSGLIRITLLQSNAPNNGLEGKKWVFATLKQVLQLYEQRPVLAEDVKRPVGRILRDLITACQVSDGAAAEALFQEINATGSLSQRNLLFLQLQALAAGQKWEAILGHSQLTDCLSGRIPMQVTRLLLQALGNKFQPLLQVGFSGFDPKHVQEECHVLAPLFRISPPFKELKNVTLEWQAWAIGAALHGLPDIASHIPADVNTLWLEQLFSWVGIKRRESTPDEDRTGKQFEEAFGFQKAQELLQYSLVAPSDELQGIVVEISEMPSHVLQQIENNSHLYDYWLSFQKKHLPREYGWNQWFADLSRHKGLEDIQILANNESMNWPEASFNSKQILETLETLDVDKFGEDLRNVMPTLVKWLQDREINCPDHFWLKLLELMALDNIVNKHDLQLAQLLLRLLLSSACRVDSYVEAIQALEILLEKVISISAYSAIIEIFDLLLENPCPAKRALQSSWAQVQKFALHKWHRLSSVEKMLTRFTAREIEGEGIEVVFQDIVNHHITKETDEVAPDLSGKLLAIYSLTEGAARRAREMLAKMFPGLKIELNHDCVATPALENLAKNAEYFVFAASSAKHQAFYAVKHIRTDLIYPNGKGASSIIKVFVDYLQKLHLPAQVGIVKFP